jgi:hypothetical protein
MSSETLDQSSPEYGVKACLHIISQMLRNSPPLGTEGQIALAELLDELGQTLHPEPILSSEVQHLAESMTHLLEVMEEENHGMLLSARERLDQAILAAEVHHPLTAGLARRLMNALANIGI